MNKQIDNYNDKGQPHGYNQWCDSIGYYNNGLWYRGNFKNNQQIGYHEVNTISSIGQEDTIVEFHIR